MARLLHNPPRAIITSLSLDRLRHSVSSMGPIRVARDHCRSEPRSSNDTRRFYDTSRNARAFPGTNYQVADLQRSPLLYTTGDYARTCSLSVHDETASTSGKASLKPHLPEGLSILRNLDGTAWSILVAAKRKLYWIIVGRMRKIRCPGECKACHNIISQ